MYIALMSYTEYMYIQNSFILWLNKRIKILHEKILSISFKAEIFNQVELRL